MNNKIVLYYTILLKLLRITLCSYSNTNSPYPYQRFDRIQSDRSDPIRSVPIRTCICRNHWQDNSLLVFNYRSVSSFVSWNARRAAFWFRFVLNERLLFCCVLIILCLISTTHSRWSTRISAVVAATIVCARSSLWSSSSSSSSWLLLLQLLSVVVGWWMTGTCWNNKRRQAARRVATAPYANSLTVPQDRPSQTQLLGKRGYPCPWFRLLLGQGDDAGQY